MPCFKVECPNYRIACDIDTCPRYLTNIRVDVGPNGELVGQGFCNERGTRYFSKIPQEKITSDATLTNTEPVRPRSRLDELRLEKIKWMNDHADAAQRYNLIEIEIGLLAAMPETSVWRFLKTCRILETNVRNATERFDPLLDYWTWFKWGLSILAKSPYSNRIRSKQNVESIKDEMSEAIADLVIELINWRKKCLKINFFEIDGGSPLSKAIQDNLGKYESANGSTKKIGKLIQSCLFMRDGDIVRYDGEVFDSILSSCHYNLLDASDIADDVMKEVFEYSMFFIEENDCGWYDEDFDKWHYNAVTKIDLARQAALKASVNSKAEHVKSVHGLINESAAPIPMQSTANDTTRAVSEAYPFIKDFDDKRQRLTMDVFQQNGAQTSVTITVIDGNTVWKVIRQFVLAKSSPITIANPRAKGPLNLSAMFKKTRNKKDNRHVFYRFVRTVGKGCKAKYELSQTLVR